jgi:3-hydroxyacyl-CoA dehydrogenase
MEVFVGVVIELTVAVTFLIVAIRNGWFWKKIKKYLTKPKKDDIIKKKRKGDKNYEGCYQYKLGRI